MFSQQNSRFTQRSKKKARSNVKRSRKGSSISKFEQLEARQLLTADPISGGLAPVAGVVETVEQTVSSADRERLIVELSGLDVMDEVIASLDDDVELIHRLNMVPYIAISVPADSVEDIGELTHVVSVSPDTISTVALDASVPLIRAASLHDPDPQTAIPELDGSGTTVVILDTGIDSEHPFFGDRIVAERCYSSANAGETSLCPNGQSTDNSANTRGVEACDNSVLEGFFFEEFACQHGTHVAGIAAGSKTDAPSAPGNGVAPGANIIAMQVFIKGADGKLGSYGSDQAAALDETLMLSMQNPEWNIVSVNMSLGGDEKQSFQCDGGIVGDSIDALLANGIATVIAAGNESFQDGVSSPGCIAAAVTVGSTTIDDTISGFSNRGSLLDVFAPGSDIESSIQEQCVIFVFCSTYQSKNGTSMAAPHVAGAFALLRQNSPDKPIENLIADLRDTGTPITYTSGGNVVTTNRIDVLSAAILSDPNDEFFEAQDLILGASDSVIISTTDPAKPFRQVRMYRFELTAPGVVAFDTDRAEGELDSYLRLFDDSGNELAFGDDGRGFGDEVAGTDSYLEFYISSPGIYYLGVSQFGNTGYDPITGSDDANEVLADGQVAFWSRNLGSDNDRKISDILPSHAIGDVVEGELTSAADVDLIKVLGAVPGQSVTFRAVDSATEQNFDARLTLYDANGAEVARDDNQLNHTFSQAGTFYLGIHNGGLLDSGAHNAINGVQAEPVEEYLDSRSYLLTLESPGWRIPLEWDLDEGSGTVIGNRTSPLGSGSFAGDPQWVPGVRGTALEFDGSGDGVLVDPSVSRNGRTDFTLSAWVRTTSSGVVITQRAVSNQLNGQVDLEVSANGRLRFWTYGGAESFNINSDVSVNDGTWHHVVAQREGREGRIYVDGRLAGTGEGDIASLNPQHQITIGFDARGNTRHFDGTLDEIRVFSSAVNISSFDQINGAVNAGGPALDPSWERDNFLSPSYWHSGGSIGLGDTNDEIDDSHPSVPAGTPMALFQTERFGTFFSGGDMAWEIPVVPGDYDVSLYFAEFFHASPGNRIFDVSIEGNQVLDNYDIVADVGAKTGVVKTYRATSDERLDIDFDSVVGNSKIAAIRFVPVPASPFDQWEDTAVSVGAGFTATDISEPQLVDIGPYDVNTGGGITYEFIYNASNRDGVSQAFMGSRNGNGSGQSAGLKLYQGSNKETYGSTEFGVRDYCSDVANAVGIDTHVVFVADETDMDIYVNGEFAETMSGASVTVSGLTGLGHAYDHFSGNGFDPFDGTILGVAVYDVALGGNAIRNNFNSFTTQQSNHGDFNADGNYDCLDVDALSEQIVNGSNAAGFDLTGDNQVDQADLDQWLTAAGSINLPSGNAYIRGDANLDGRVDSIDLNVVGVNWQTNVVGWCSGDFSMDGVVSSVDLNELGVNWQKNVAAASLPMRAPRAALGAKAGVDRINKPNRLVEVEAVEPEVQPIANSVDQVMKSWSSRRKSQRMIRRVSVYPQHELDRGELLDRLIDG